MVRKKDITKIVEPKPEVSIDGRLDRYWKDRGIINLYTKFRPGFVMPKNITIDIPEPVIRKFHLNGLEFGNWVGVEDRKNYLAALTIALFDLNKILGFNHNIGLNNTIGIAFGARGASTALAHFEPLSFMINLTRHKSLTKINKHRHNMGMSRLPSSPEVRAFLFERTGGVGSLAHEYGHAIDYFFGTYIHQDRYHRSLTQGRSVSTRIENNYPANSLRYLALKVIETIIWQKPGKKSEYYLTLEKKFVDNDYWFRHTELFARAFEVFIQYRLSNLGIKNEFLTHGKYNAAAYLNEKDFKRILPWMTKLIIKIRKEVNK